MINPLFMLIEDGKITSKALGVTLIKKSSNTYGEYYLIRLINSISINKESPCFEHNGKSYHCIESHLSIYKNISHKEEKIPVLSCYHYTATYVSNNDKDDIITIRIYFGSTGCILLTTAKQIDSTLSLSDEALCSAKNTAKGHCMNLSETIHNQWMNIIADLKNSLTNQEARLDESSKSIVDCENKEILMKYLDNLNKLIQLYDNYVKYAYQNKNGIAIKKVLEKTYELYKAHYQRLQKESTKKGKKALTTESVSCSSSSLTQVTSTLKESTKTELTKREKNLEKTQNEIRLMGQEPNNSQKLVKLRQLYLKKLNLMLPENTKEVFETLKLLRQNHILSQAQLLKAARDNDLNEFEALKDNYDDMEYITITNFLFYVVEKGYIELFEKGLSVFNDYNLFSCNIQKNASLIIAACDNSDNEKAYALTKILYDHIDSPQFMNIACDLLGRSLLYIAVERDNIKLVELFIKKKLDVNSPQGFPGLILPVDRKDPKIKQKAAAMQEIIDNDKSSERTPLHIAALNHFDDIILLLLENGADPTVREIDGFNALGIYLYQKSSSPKPPRNQKIIQAFCDKGCNINDYHGQNKNGITSLGFAAQEGDFETVELLLELGANPNLRAENQGILPLTTACRKGFDNIVEALLAYPQLKVSGDDFIVSFFVALQERKYSCALQLLNKYPNYWDSIKQRCFEGIEKQENQAFIIAAISQTSDNEIEVIEQQEVDKRPADIETLTLFSPLLIDRLNQPAATILERQTKEAQKTAKDRFKKSAPLKVSVANTRREKMEILKKI